LRGRDIKRYGYNWGGLYLIAAHNGIQEKGIPKIDIKKYPAVKTHLDSYWAQIEKRTDQGDTPYHLRSCAYMEDFSKPKIVWIELVDRPNFALDETGIMANNTVFFITGRNIHFLLAYLNSRLCDWQFGKICATSGTGTRRWIKQYIEQILIPFPKPEVEQLIQRLVEKMGTSTPAEKAKLSVEIDHQIFALFNFTKDGIAFLSNCTPTQ